MKKQCKKCLKIFPATLEYFYKSTNNKKDNLNSSCKSCIKQQSVKWQKENADAYKEYYTKRNSTDEYIEKIRIKNEELRRNGTTLNWQRNNKDKISNYQKNRKEMKKALRNDLSTSDLDLLINTFGEKCALTGSVKFHLDHFIPVSWGHGGSYSGNVLFLNRSLNQSKHSSNPFEWIKQEKIMKSVNQEKWNKLVSYLAEQNNLTVDEFTSFVYWCEKNKRTLEAVNESNKTSIELWLEVNEVVGIQIHS